MALPTIIGVAIIALALVAGVGSRFVFKKTDTPIEEIAEKVIKDITGYDVDLSPDNPDGIMQDDKTFNILKESEFDMIKTGAEPLKGKDESKN